MILYELPEQEKIKTNFYSFLSEFGSKSVEELYKESISNPEKFWKSFISFKGIKIDLGKTFVSDFDTFHLARFFPDSKISILKNIPFELNLPAIYDLTNGIEIKYNELPELVKEIAGWLENQGVKKIFCILPNRVEAVLLFLASQAIGIQFCIVGPESGIEVIRSRIVTFQPDLIVAVSSHSYQNFNLESLISEDFLIENRIKMKVLGDNFEENINSMRFSGSYDITRTFDFNHPMAVLFTSGTTGKPKGLIHTLGGFILENQKELWLHSNLSKGDRFFYYTTTSWMMWYWLIGGLMQGATIYLYDGDPLGESKLALWKIVQEHSINFFGTSARHINITQKNWDPKYKAPDSLKVIFSTGSPLYEHNFEFIYEHVKNDVLLYSISGGTDILGCFVLGCPLLPIKSGCLQMRSLSFDVRVLDDDGKEIFDREGELVCFKPMISKPLGLLNDPTYERFKNTYFSVFPNIWRHGDYAILYSDGFMKILGRSDSTLKPGGVRIGTGEIYRVVEELPEVKEALVVAKKKDGNDELVLFIVADVSDFEILKSQIINQIKKKLSRFHVPKYIIQAPGIPKTKNNKPLELLVSKIINEGITPDPQTIDDPSTLEFFKSLKFD